MSWWRLATQYCEEALYSPAFFFLGWKFVSTTDPFVPSRFLSLGLFFLQNFICFSFKLNSSTYFSYIPQLKAGLTSIGPLYPCFCGSLWLTAVVGQGPASASLSTINTTIAACTSTWFTTSLLFSYSTMAWPFPLSVIQVVGVTVCLAETNSWHHVMLLVSKSNATTVYYKALLST